MAVTGAILIGATQVATTGYSIYQSERANSKAEAAATKQEKQQKRLLAEAKDQDRRDGLALERDSKRAAQRSNQVAAQSANKGGTATSTAPTVASTTSGAVNPSPLGDSLMSMYGYGGRANLLGA